MGPKLRFTVFNRDGFRCQYCGRSVPDVVLEADHIIPRVDGGDDSLGNLITSCFDCNRGKGKERLKEVENLPVNESLQTDIEERKLQLEAYFSWVKEYESSLDTQLEYVLDKWFAVTNFDSIDEKDAQSIRNFIKRIGLSNVLEAITVTGSSNIPWSKTRRVKYLFGVLWNMKRRSENNGDCNGKT